MYVPSLASPPRETPVAVTGESGLRASARNEELSTHADGAAVTAAGPAEADALTGQDVDISESESHHLVHVLRARPGDEIVVFDGAGREWGARIAGTTPRSVRVTLLASQPPVAEPPVRLTLAVALLKGDAMDEVIRDATALGAAVVVPMTSAHVTVPERVWRARSTDRWTRVAVSAAKQSGRAVVPVVHPVTPLADILASTSADLRVLCAEPGIAEGQTVTALTRPRSALVCIGPEGGWSPKEIEAARANGAVLVACGPRTIRSTLMPAVVLAALWTQWGWE